MTHEEIITAIAKSDAAVPQPCARTGQDANAVLIRGHLSPGYGSRYDCMSLEVAPGRDAGPEGPICDDEITRLLDDGVLQDPCAVGADLIARAEYRRHLANAIELVAAVTGVKIGDRASFSRFVLATHLAQTSDMVRPMHAVLTNTPMEHTGFYAHQRALAVALGMAVGPATAWPPTEAQILAEIEEYMADHAAQRAEQAAD